MGIINDLRENIKKLIEENDKLLKRMNLLESKMTVSELKTPTVKHILPPNIPKTLDANNVWIGEKGITEYTDMGILDMWYDENVKKWKSNSDFKLKLVKEETVNLSTPSPFTPPPDQKLNRYYFYIPKDDRLKIYFFEAEYRLWNYKNSNLTSIRNNILTGTYTGMAYATEDLLGFLLPIAASRVYTGEDVYTTKVEAHYKLYEFADLGERLYT